MQIVFLGPPGAGKGTQAERLASRLGLPHVSTGDIFRQNLAQGTPLGQKAKSFMEQGTLVPDDVTQDMVKDRLSQSDCTTGFVLDGFPRNVPQAEALSRMLRELAKPLSAVLLLELERAGLVERLTGRRVCSGCGATFHVSFHPPREAETCDACGGHLVQRKDDRPETVEKRLEVYDQETRPLVEYYQERGLLQPVDGDGPMERITERILAVLPERGA